METPGGQGLCPVLFAALPAHPNSDWCIAVAQTLFVSGWIVKGMNERAGLFITWMIGPREPWECHQHRHLTCILPPKRACQKRVKPGSQGFVRGPCSARESPALVCLTLLSLAAFYTHLLWFHETLCWANCIQTPLHSHHNLVSWVWRSPSQRGIWGTERWNMLPRGTGLVSAVCLTHQCGQKWSSVVNTPLPLRAAGRNAGGTMCSPSRNFSSSWPSKAMRKAIFNHTSCAQVTQRLFPGGWGVFCGFRQSLPG